MRVRRRHAWGVVLIVLFVLPVLKPGGIPALERPVGSFFAWFGRIPALNPQLWSGKALPEEEEPSARARALEEENAYLREAMARRLLLESDLSELDRVRKALQNEGLDRLPRVLGARVLRGADAGPGHRRSILIDRGGDDGLRPGMAIVSGRVFVGRVEVVQRRSSLVKLVTDRRSRLEVALRTDKNVRLRGFVRGDGRGTKEGTLDLRFLFTPQEAGRVPLDTAVQTSNADPLVPAGLIVGYVTEVCDEDLDGIPLVRVRPALDLDRSTRVFVLLPQ